MMLQDFHFLRPWWLLGFLPMGWILWKCLHCVQTGGTWRQICDAHLLPHLLMGREKAGEKLPWMLLGLGWCLTLVALAGPVWSKLPQPVVRSQSALVIILDLSRSMDAQDVRPSRLIRAKHKVLDLLNRRAEGQTALIVFAGSSFVVSPLSDDAKTIASMVPALSTDLMPVQGSRPEQALEQADLLLENGKITKGHILLITDSGERETVTSTVSRLYRKGRVVSVLAVGTEEGAPIPVRNGGFFKDSSGAIVIPKLNTRVLHTWAQSGGGPFVILQTDDQDLDAIQGAWTNRLSFEEAKESQKTTDRWREEGPWLVLAVLLTGVPAFRKGWLGVVIVMCLLSPFPAHAWNWEDMWSRSDQRASRLLQEGHPKEAAELFSDEQWQGVARYRSGQYEQAAEAFAGQEGPEGRYNQGNALARLGKYQEALAAYERALKDQPDHEDARHNADLMRKLLERQRQESSQSQNSSGHQSDKLQDSNAASKAPENQNGTGAEPRNSQEDSEQSSARQSREGDPPHPSENSPQGKQESHHASTFPDNESSSDDPAKQKPSQPSMSDSHKASSETDTDKKDNSQMAHRSSDRQEEQEERQAMEQWLRRIPDDPGGLLRRKFLLEHQRRGNANQGMGQTW